MREPAVPCLPPSRPPRPLPPTEAVVFGNVNPLLILVTCLDYLVVLPLLLVPPALVHTYTDKLLYANNVSRLMLTSHAQSVDDLSDHQLLAGTAGGAPPPGEGLGHHRSGAPAHASGRPMSVAMVRMASFTAGSRRGVLVGDRRAHASPGDACTNTSAKAEARPSPPGADAHSEARSLNQSRRSRSGSLAYSVASTTASERKRVEALWRDVQAVDSFAIMLQTSRPYARILFIPVTFELVGKLYTFIISGAYLFGRLVRHGI